MSKSIMLPKSLAINHKPQIPLSRVSQSFVTSLYVDFHSTAVFFFQIELHVHLDGAPRLETIWELLKAKNLPIPGNGTLGDLKDAVSVKEPQNLMFFLSGFQHFAPAFK